MDSWQPVIALIDAEFADCMRYGHRPKVEEGCLFVRLYCTLGERQAFGDPSVALGVRPGPAGCRVSWDANHYENQGDLAVARKTAEFYLRVIDLATRINAMLAA